VWLNSRSISREDYLYSLNSCKENSSGFNSNLNLVKKFLFEVWPFETWEVRISRIFSIVL